MINEEIEEGELTSDDETNSFVQEKVFNIEESGQLTDQNGPTSQNPYTEEDVGLLKLLNIFFHILSSYLGRYD